VQELLFHWLALQSESALVPSFEVMIQAARAPAGAGHIFGHWLAQTITTLLCQMSGCRAAKKIVYTSRFVRVILAQGPC